MGWTQSSCSKTTCLVCLVCWQPAPGCWICLWGLLRQHSIGYSAPLLSWHSKNKGDNWFNSSDSGMLDCCRCLCTKLWHAGSSYIFSSSKTELQFPALWGCLVFSCCSWPRKKENSVYKLWLLCVTRVWKVLVPKSLLCFGFLCFGLRENSVWSVLETLVVITSPALWFRCGVKSCQALTCRSFGLKTTPQHCV